MHSEAKEATAEVSVRTDHLGVYRDSEDDALYGHNHHEDHDERAAQNRTSGAEQSPQHALSLADFAEPERQLWRSVAAW
ncbi:MAG TPA: hypothetical protein VGN51_07685 [Acidimicrobiia bacterium]